MLSLHDLRDGEFLVERRLAYQAMLLFGIAYVFDTRGFWLIALAIAAGRLIWLRRSYNRGARTPATGDADPDYVRWDIERRLSDARRHGPRMLWLAGLMVAVGLPGRVSGDTRFWISPLVLSALFIAQALRYRDAAVLLERARAASVTAPQGALHSSATTDGAP